MGTSTRPVLLIFPTSEKIFVPLLPAVPMFRYHETPLRMIRGTFAQVSTLFRHVGRSKRPLSVACTYFARGSPARPSMEAKRAEDSPQTNAPPPRVISTSKPNPLPRISAPRRPHSRALPTAWDMFRTANGYSLRT